jgi:hypothetical protein
LQFLRMKNIYGGQSPMTDPNIIGSDMPSQGGFFGSLNSPDVNDYSSQAINPDVPPLETPRAAPTGMNTPDNYDVGARMSQLYHPEHAASDRFNQLSGAYPKRADYHPGKLRSIGAMITSVGSSFGPHGNVQFNPEGIKMGQEIQDEPYLDKLSDWRNQIGPAQQAANLERYTNTNDRSLAYQTVTREQAQQKETARQGEADRKLKVAEARSKTYDWKTRNGAGWTFDFSGPTVSAANKSTGEVKDTGISTKHMSDEDKLEMKQEFERENIGSRGAEAQATAGVGASSREKIAEMKGWDVVNVPDPNNAGQMMGVRINRDTGEVKPIQLGEKNIGLVTRPSSNVGSTAKPEKPSDTRAREYNTASELYNTRPDLRPFIKLGKNNDVKISPPGAGGFFSSAGPNPAQAQELYQKIYGGSAPQPIPSHGPAPAAKPVVAAPAAPQRIVKTQRNKNTGETRQVESLDGGQTWQPISK